MSIDLGEVHGFEFLLGVGSELVDALLVGVGRVGVVLLNGLHVLLEDADAIGEILRGEVEHEAVSVPPLVEHIRCVLFDSLVEEEGGNGECDSQKNSLLHVCILNISCQNYHQLTLVSIASEFIKSPLLLFHIIPTSQQGILLRGILTTRVSINGNEWWKSYMVAFMRPLRLQNPCDLWVRFIDYLQKWIKDELFRVCGESGSYSMNLMRQKALKLAESIRKQQRQEMMISRRNWHEVPSPVFQLPYRIENNQWDHFEDLLDVLSQKKHSDLVEEGLKQYLLEQWQRITHPVWQNQAALNIIRILLRLQIANRHHGGLLLEMASAAGRESGESEAGEAVLKLLKEVAISLQVTANTINEDEDLWRGELRDRLNSFAASLKICRQASDSPSFHSLFRDYHLYYLILLADHRVSIEQFVRIDNIGELLFLINDSLDRSDNFYLRKVIQLIKKMLNAANGEQIDRSLQALSLFCISGLGTALAFLEGKESVRKEGGSFFYRFIKIVGSGDADTVLQATQLIALLFSRFDDCIPAAFGVRIQAAVHNDPQGVQVMRPKQHCTLASLLESVLEHLLIEVRVNGYWAISNVTGSPQYFRQHGLPFIAHIYRNDFLHLESKQFVIQEITFCVLNYLCNITHQAEVQELAGIEAGERTGRMPNCLLFCLQATANILEDISNTSEYRSILTEQYLGIIQRAVFALYILLHQAGPLTDILCFHLHRKGIEAHLERMQDRLTGQEQACQAISTLLTALQSKDSPL